MASFVEYTPGKIVINPVNKEDIPQLPTVTANNSIATTGTATNTVTNTNDWKSRLDKYYAEIQPKISNAQNTAISGTQKISGGTPLQGTITGSAEYEKAWEEYLKKDPDAAQYKNILSRIVQRESAFKNVQNYAGAPAYGYFQLWKTNLGGLTPEQVLADPVKQVELAVKLARRNMKTFTDADYQKAQQLGFTKDGMLFGAWLGGVGGVRNYLYKGIDASDAHHYGGKGGSSIGKYIRMAREGGYLDKEYQLIEIGDKEYYIQIAETDEEKSVGLSKLKKLPSNEGMLFIINKEDKDEDGLIWFTMEDTDLSLDIIFLDKELEVVQISKGEPLSKEPVYGKADYVLEVNSDSGINIGDELDFETEKEINQKMLVLDTDGNPQMTLDGGERIFSIPNTKILIRFAKKASATNNDNDYKALGKRVFKFLTAQDESEPEYV